MENIGWIKSVRSITAILFAFGINLGLFLGKISPDLYKDMATIVLSAYFLTGRKVSSDK